MKWMLKSLVFGFTALTLGASVGHAKGGGHGHGGGLRAMMSELNLTPEQTEKAKKIHKDGREGVKGKREAMKKAHEELEVAIKGKATDEEVRAKFATLQKAQDELATARFEKVLAFRAILTPEQRAKMKGPRELHRGGHEGGGSEGDDD